MGAKLPPEAKEGQALSASWLNDLRACVAEALKRAGIRVAGLDGSQGVHGTTLAGVSASGGTILVGKAPGGGIAAGATGTITLYQYGSLTTLGAQTLVVYNPGPDALPANRKVWIGEANGKANSVLWWSCLSA
jgi:hypothetical protein